MPPTTTCGPASRTSKPSLTPRAVASGRSSFTTAAVTRVLESENNRQVWFRVPQPLAKYIFVKGYIGIDGISLTIGEVAGDEFNVNLIPETLARTNMGWRQAGDRVNIEIDPQTQAIVDTVERVLAEREES